MLFGKKKELQAMPKKGVREWTQQLRRLYNTYSMKEMRAGREPIPRDRWIQIHG